MRSPFHLTYCTNIHAADGWEAVFANLRQYAPALEGALLADARRSASACGSRRARRASCSTATACRSSGAFLDREGLYVAIINGFPYGHFHGTPVKARRLRAGLARRCARRLHARPDSTSCRRSLPEGLDGGVSTAPLSYKAWMTGAGLGRLGAITRNVARVAEALVRLRRERGALIHLDIEPEPDCVDREHRRIDRRSSSAGCSGRRAGCSAAALGVEPTPAPSAHLRDHIRLCFDCCHFAVEYEDPAAALERLQRAGIQIGRVQLSSALDVAFPGDRAGSNAMAARAAAVRRLDLPASGRRAARRRPASLSRSRRGARRLAPSMPDASGAFTSMCRSSRATTTSFGSTQDYVEDRDRTWRANGALHARISRSRPTPGTCCRPG